MRIHDQEKKKALMLRLSKVEGQVRGVAKMIEKEEDCTKIAEQLAAAKSALSRVLASFAVCAFEEVEHPHTKHNKDSLQQIVKSIS